LPVLPLKCFIAANVHGTYCVPAASRQRPAARAILEGKVWEAETLAFLTGQCGSGDVVHAGTYFGDFLPALAKGIAEGARVWAFEPSRENFRCAQITLKLNEIGNVTLTHAALGSGPSDALLCIGGEGRRSAGGSSAIATKKEAGRFYETVRVVALDDIIPRERNVSVLQLDVEKYEQPALAGALATIRRCRPLLVMENLPADPDWFAANILSLGYEPVARVDVNHALRAKPEDQIPAAITMPS
jgi:FkbM family methyltransferase